MKINSTWGLVCGAMWQMPDPATAGALCRALGHSGEGAELTAVEAAGQQGLPALISAISCPGVDSIEASDMERAYDFDLPGAVAGCGDSTVAALKCRPLPAPPGRADKAGGGLSEGHRR